jgi:hypothetical protein
VGAAIVAGVDASPVLEPTEHILDLVALAVERLVMWDRRFAVGLGRDASCDVESGQGVAEPVGVIAFVAEKRFGPGKASSIRAAAWSFEFKPPLVRPIRRGTGPFF